MEKKVLGAFESVTKRVSFYQRKTQIIELLQSFFLPLLLELVLKLMKL